MRLGWLVSPVDQRIREYRPGADPVMLKRSEEISDEDLLPKQVVDPRRIWRSG